MRDYIHVSELANAHLKALQRMRAGGGYGKAFSVFEVLKHVKAVSGQDFPVRFAGRREGAIRSSRRCNTETAKMMLRCGDGNR